MEEVICKETEYKRQSKGWFFVPWYCYPDTTRIDLMEMQAIISDADFNALQRLFSGEIQTPKEREDLDKYFCIEPYTITWELATYYRTLQLYNVAGKDEALFDTIKPYGLPDCTEQLLIAQVQLINATLGGRGKRENKTRTREGNFPSCSSLKNDYLCPLPKLAKYESSNQGAKVHNFRDETTRFQK